MLLDSASDKRDTIKQTKRAHEKVREKAEKFIVRSVYTKLSFYWDQPSTNTYLLKATG